MFSQLAAASLLAAVTMAQTSTITYVAGADLTGDEYDLAGSVVSACPGTTILALQCTDGTGSYEQDACGADGPMATYTVGPSILHYTTNTETAGTTVELEISCAVTGTTSLSCQQSVMVSADGDNNAVQTGRELSGDQVALKTATITAGAEKLNATGACAADDTSGGTSIGGDKTLVGMSALGLGSLIAAVML